MSVNVLQLTNDTVGDIQEIAVLEVGATAGGDLTGTFPNPTLAAVGSAGTYAYPASITTDSKGRVTSITAGSSSVTTTIPSVTNSSGSTIAANKAVNIYDNSGTLTMRLANSTSTNYPVHGFTIASVADSATGTVQTGGYLSGFGGGVAAADAGANFFSDPSAPGSITKTATNTANQYQQKVGYGAGSGALMITIDRAIKQA